jgi:hypothetical protein
MINAREAIGFITSVIPFAGANNDAHVIVFPRVGHIWQVFIRAVEVNVVVVIPSKNELISNDPLKLIRRLTASG